MMPLHTHTPRRPGGAILLLVLGAVAILSVLAVELYSRSMADVRRVTMAKREAACRRVIDSGLELSKAALCQIKKNDDVDYFGDRWARRIERECGSEEKFVVTISDESGKLNILKATGDSEQAAQMRKCLVRLFAYLKKAEPEREKEWMAAEQATQKRLGFTGTDKAVPPLTLDGLREGGISKEMLYGNPQQREAGKLALCDVFTVFGEGKINLNTAHPAVLYALEQGYDESIVEAIERWRGKSDKEASDAQFRPFKEIKDLETVKGIVETQLVDGKMKVTKNLFLKAKDLLAVKSDCFCARIEAHVNGHSRLAYGFYKSSTVLLDAKKITSVELECYEEVEP